MHTDAPGFLRMIRKGVLFGAGAWSAYAVMEFCFSSVAFRLTRPYAVFASWHWQLTALVVVAYLVCGALAGALTGLAVAFFKRHSDSSAHAAGILESATALVLVSALVIHEATYQGFSNGGSLLLAIGIVFLALLILSVRSTLWCDRLGWLTNAWTIAVMWLGVGLAMSILRIRLASQLGYRLELVATGMFVGLLAAAAAAVMIGRWARRMSGRDWTIRLNALSCSVAALLVAVSALLGFSSTRVAGAEPGAVSSSPRPNLVLIVMDTVRGDHLSLDGYQRDTTPNLKALAQDSVNYTNALSAADITLTSHASLFTGMYPSWHGAYCNPPNAVYGMELSRKYPTIAETLKRSGYETLGVAANLYLRADFGLERGFDVFSIPRPVPMLPDESGHMLRHTLRRGISYFADTAEFDRLYAFGEDVNRDLFSTIERRSHQEAPFFAFVNYMDAHFPYVPPAPYNARFPGRKSRMTQDDLQKEMVPISRGEGQPADYRPHCESQYDGGIAYEDAQIGQIVDWLKRHNAYDNTMIVVTADHGESFGEKNRVGHANSPYQNLLHVGLLIKYPNSSRRGTETLPVSLVDVMPTALSVLNIPAPPDLQGKPLVAGAEPARRIFAETFVSPVTHSPDCPDGCATRIVFEWPMKLVSNLTNGRVELFDLGADPTEQHNLFATQQDRAAPLRAHLNEWAKDLPRHDAVRKTLVPGIQKGLEGNGYVQK